MTVLPLIFQFVFSIQEGFQRHRWVYFTQQKHDPQNNFLSLKFPSCDENLEHGLSWPNLFQLKLFQCFFLKSTVAKSLPNKTDLYPNVLESLPNSLFSIARSLTIKNLFLVELFFPSNENP